MLKNSIQTAVQAVWSENGKNRSITHPELYKMV
jgi:hypothetical protein